MRTLLLAVLLCGISAAQCTSPCLTHQWNYLSFGGATTAVDSTGGTLIVIALHSDGNGTTPNPANITISDTLTGCASNCNAFTVLTAAVETAATMDVLIVARKAKDGGPLKVGANHVFTIGGSIGLGQSTALAVYSGTKTSVHLQNGGPGATAGSGLTIQPGSISPGSGELVITSVGHRNGTTATISSPYAITDYLCNSSQYCVGQAFQVTAGGATNPTWTFPGSTFHLESVIASFQAVNTNRGRILN